MQFILKLTAACCILVSSGGTYLGGVYAMNRVGEDSDYAFEFEEYGVD